MNKEVSTTESGRNKYAVYLPWLIVLAAVIVRLIYFSDITTNNPYFHDETLVAEVHHEWAKDIVSGNPGESGEVFIRAPLYPYLVAAIYRIFGPDTMYPRLIQLLLGAMLTYPIYLIARRIFGYKEAIAAAAIWALYGPMIFFEGELFETSLTTAAIFGAFFFWNNALARSRLLHYAVTGLLLGAAVILKPNSALFILVLLIWQLFFNRGDEKRIKHSSVFFMAALIVILPVTLRNAIVGKEFVPVAAYGGLNIYIGANEHADGVSAVIPDAVETEIDLEWGRQHHATALTAMSIRLAREETGEDITPAEASDYWYGQALKFAVKNPLKFAWLNIKKAVLYFNGFEYGNTRDLYFSRDHSALLSLLLWNQGIKFPLGLLLPFAGLGLFYSIQNKNPYTKRILLFLLTAAASATLVFVCARFRMTAIPFLVILAGYGVVEAFRNLSGKRVMVNAGIFIPLVLLFNLNIFGLEKDTSYQEYYNLGRNYLAKGEFQKGYDNLMKSVESKQDFVPALNELGVLLEGFGKYPQAVYYYGQVLSYDTGNAVSLYNLGAAEGKGGALDSAAVHLRQAVDIDPDFWQAWLNLGNVRLYAGDPDSAEACYLTASEILPENPDVLFNLGNFYMMQKKNREARQYFDMVKVLAPDYPALDDIIQRMAEQDD